jgi:hypothetical protein
MPKPVSASIPDALADRTRAIAREENRSLANVVENALGVFTALPRELRTLLVARLAEGGPTDEALREATRQMAFSLARRRFDEARDRLVKSVSTSDHPDDPEIDDLVIIDTSHAA